MTAGTSLQLAAYRLAARALRALPLRGKVRASVLGRQAAIEYWLAWGRSRPRHGPVVWVHAASVGEALVAEPVLRRLQAAAPDLNITLTYSSPSMASWPHSIGAAATGYAPPEEPAAVAAVFDAINPDLLAFSRSDLWPELLLAARERKVPAVVIGGTVRPQSPRLRWPARPFLRNLYGQLRFVGAVSTEDADRWTSLGAPERSVVVTGDPRHDQVLERVSDLAVVRTLVAWSRRGPTLVAGSVEESDEVPLLAGLAAVMRDHAEARMLLVPHDPTTASVRRLRERARRSLVSAEVLEPGREPTAPCVIVAQRGTLADLYALGSVSYVGGGFGHPGLHAVIEPASYGLPVLIGPDYVVSADAVRLVGAGGVVPLPRRGSVLALATRWRTWLEDQTARDRVGRAARQGLQQGAAAATTRHLLTLLPG